MAPNPLLVRIYKGILLNEQQEVVARALFKEYPALQEKYPSSESIVPVLNSLVYNAVDIGHVFPRGSKENVIKDGKEHVTLTLDGLAYYHENKHLIEHANSAENNNAERPEENSSLD